MDYSFALAVVHLRFRRSAYDKGDVIDAHSGLTADDLNRVFEALRDPYPLTAKPRTVGGDQSNGG